MDRPGHLRRLIAAALALSAAGCSYGEARLRDFGDIFRLEGQAGYGLQAHANAGELFHGGAGSSRQWSAGVRYGRAESSSATEHHLPWSLVASIARPAREHAHGMDLALEDGPGSHRCYLIFPGAINPGTVKKDSIHYFDLEAGFLALVVGLEAGFSAGELLDWFLGLFRFSESWTFLDPADDDDLELRDVKRLWILRRTREGIVLPE